jgi:hypothetical protein
MNGNVPWLWAIAAIIGIGVLYEINRTAAVALFVVAIMGMVLTVYSRREVLIIDTLPRSGR